MSIYARMLCMVALLWASQALAQSEGNFYCSPLTLNGKPFNMQRCYTDTKGKLSLMMGDPKSAKASPVPIKVYVRRKGKIIAEQSASTDAKGQLEVELSTLLLHANPGDELVVEPVRPSDQKGKCVVILKSKPLFYMLIANSDDDC